MTAAVSVARRMSISRSEFFRTLAEALGTNALTVSADRVRIDTPGRHIEVVFCEEAPLRIASLTLPSAVIQLRFEGYGEPEIAASLERFDLYFRRGGG